MSLAVTLVGHGTLFVEIDGYRLVIDPFYAPNNPAASQEVDSVEADYILVTHAHADHTADLLALAKSTGAIVISNVEICNWMSRHGHDSVHGMNTGGSYTFPFGRVKLTDAVHSSGFPDGTNGGHPVGFVIFAGSQKLYVAGDTALFSDMSLIGRLGIDVAVLPIGDNFTMGPEDALVALELLSPGYVIPYHYNTWPLIEVDADAWVQQVETTTSVVPVALAAGERREF